MVAEAQLPLMTVEEYLALERSSEERYEYIDGRVHLMAGGTTTHGALGLAVGSIFRALLRGGSCRVYPSDVRVRISPTRYVYPDVSVSCDERDRRQVEEVRAPRVIVEVLSPSTEGYDRGDKSGYYRACPTIEEYLLVNARRAEIELYRRSGGFWALHTFGPNDEIELMSLGIRFPVSEVYEGIDLPAKDAENQSTTSPV